MIMYSIKKRNDLVLQQAPVLQDGVLVHAPMVLWFQDK